MRPPDRHTMYAFQTLEDVDTFEVHSDQVMGGAEITSYLPSTCRPCTSCARPQVEACALSASFDTLNTPLAASRAFSRTVMPRQVKTAKPFAASEPR